MILADDWVIIGLLQGFYMSHGLCWVWGGLNSAVPPLTFCGTEGVSYLGGTCVSQEHALQTAGSLDQWWAEVRNHFRGTRG